MNSLSSVTKALLLVFLSLLAAAALLAAGWARGDQTTIAGAALLLVLLLPAGWWLRRGSANIDRAIAALELAADGKLDARVAGVQGRGNIGRMLLCLNRLLEQTETFAKQADRTMRAAAEKQFDHRIPVADMRGDFQRCAEDVNAAAAGMQAEVQRLAAFEAQMLRAAVAISMTVNEGAMANARIVGGIRNAMEQAQAMAAATEEMVAGVNEISHSSDGAVNLSTDAQNLTDDARQVVGSAMSEFAAIETAVADAAARVDGLAKASAAIGGILSSIESIAGQTNLLALNATIEAARAGEAGKGFAVVAGEVKNLANQTARATEDISHRINNLRDEMSGIVATMQRGAEAVAKGRESMQSMGGQMAGVSDTVHQATQHMGEVSRVLAQQAAAANQISGGVQQVAHRAEDNAHAIEASSKALMSVGQEMTSLLALLADRDIPDKIIMLAKADHVIWKKRLVDLMVGADGSRLNPDELSNEKGCRLGKWYYGPGSMTFRDHPAYRRLEEPHRAVHQNGIEAVRLFNAGQVDDALKRLALVEDASTQVIGCLDQLMRAADAPARPAREAGF